MYDKFNNEVAKYKKKKKKKKAEKSNHKHDYSKEILIQINTKYGLHYHYATMCIVCGKIGEEKYMETKKEEGSRYYRFLNQDEILEKYKDLPIIVTNKSIYQFTSKEEDI